MSRRGAVTGALTVLLLLSGCASGQDSAGSSSPAAGSDERDTSATTSDAPEADRATTSATPEGDPAPSTSASTTPTTSDSGSSPEGASPSCAADDIADALGRDEVIVDACFEQWAYVSSDVPGDSAAFVRRVEGRWQDYDRQPNTRCRPEAEADGVPEPLLKYFRGCSTARAESDLGLSTEISSPACDGRGIVVLGAATAPDAYRADVSDLLQQYPGSGYLRTDETCPSLAQQTEDGEAIYAVYRPAGESRQSICAAVREAGGDAYGKRLDETSDPASVVDC